MRGCVSLFTAAAAASGAAPPLSVYWVSSPTLANETLVRNYCRHSLFPPDF